MLLSRLLSELREQVVLQSNGKEVNDNTTSTFFLAA